MNETSTEKRPVYVIVASDSRQFIGRIIDKNEKTVELVNPLLMIETARQSHTADKTEIMLNFSPILNSFPVDTVKIQWVTHFPADEGLERAYEDFWTQIRAARSGLTMARSMPQQEVAQN